VQALVRAAHGTSDLRSALRTFEAERLRIGSAVVARGRRLGAYMEAQLGSEGERCAAEERRDVHELLAETAAPVDFSTAAPTQSSA
jgi:hypothetical protein